MDPQSKLLNTMLSKLQKVKVGSIGKDGSDRKMIQMTNLLLNSAET